MFPKQLITQINSGRCFALIGSGPSTAMGYPSWRTLGLLAGQLLRANCTSTSTLQVAASLANDDRLPELFDVVADACGGMQKLVDHLKGSLTRGHATGVAYEYLAKWPIRTYLTTNYDEEIRAHLKRLNVDYASLNNSQADFSLIDAYTNERIVKLHGDFDYLDGLVLGDRQYQEFKVSGKRLYFREKLKSLFSMVPVLVVGHSMSDPDLALILETACELNSFDKPIYMIVADAAPADVRKYQEHFNIHLLSYDNSNGKHSHLIRLLRQIDCFVIPRTEFAYTPLDFPDPDECSVAASLC